MINTVLGNISEEDLGITGMHEHILWGWVGESRKKYSKKTVVNTMLLFLENLKQLGCCSLVEATTHGAGRDVMVLKEISEKSGLNIITNSGVWDGLDYNGIYVPEILKGKESDEIAKIWTEEFFHGIDGTNVKPGFIKIGLGDNDEITNFQRTILDAAVKTSLKTGLTIQAHICSPKSALEVVGIVEKNHLPLKKFIWTHADFSYDLDTILQLAKKGIWVELNWWFSKPIDFKWHAETIKKINQEKLLNRLLISQDAGGYHDGEIVPYTKLFTEFIPYCKNNGISGETFDTILIENPSEALSIRSIE